MTDALLNLLQAHFGERLQQNVRLARYTTARVGGPARWFAEAHSPAQLAEDVGFLWQNEVTHRILGNGSNLLISDAGWQGLVLLNQANEIRMSDAAGAPEIYTGSGATLNSLVRATVEAGCSGLEWAIGIPGTVGGAIYGNAGAHGQDICLSLLMAEILHRQKGVLSLSSGEMGYTYRSSAMKKAPGNEVVLSATFKLTRSTREAVQAKVDELNDRRRKVQPTGASLGSTFKNPVGDKAGRLIEAAGLKGRKIGGVEVSSVHANFLVNDGTGTAADYLQLIEMVKTTVRDRFAVELELEIELFGDWKN